MKNFRIPGSLIPLFFIAALLAPRTLHGAEIAKPKFTPFELNQVRLNESPFKEAQDKDAKYLLTVEPDRLLAKFRINAGLEPKKEHFKGWEDSTLAGHSLGHYLSAVSIMYAATGDERFKKISDYVVEELDACQKAGKDDLVSAIPNVRKVFGDVSNGDIRSRGFDLNGLWAPWYAQHKVHAGLADAYRYCGNKTALEVDKKMADWVIEITKNLSKEQFQLMLDCEFGGINESFYELYEMTGEKKYLELGDRFHHEKIIDPFFRGEDILPGKHGNTQFPKVIGLARKYELTGDPDAKKAVEFFWDCVVNHHTYLNGGNTMGEHFGPRDRLNDRLSDNTIETCNTYNMLKMSKHLYEWTGETKYLDYYERALFNHILPSIDRSDDPRKLFTYFVPLQSGGFKTYSDPFEHWTCCHGTGMENHAKYGGAIFYKGTGEKAKTLYINLLIPSTLDWKEEGLKVTITDDFKIIVEAEKESNIDIMVRMPRNMQTGVDLVFGYYHLTNTWKAGETVKELPFGVNWVLETMPDNENKVAFFKGPWMLAGNLGPISKPIAGQFEPPSDAKITIPVIVSESRIPQKLLSCENFTERSCCEDHFLETELIAARPTAVEMIPFYQTRERYAVYFDFFTEKQWKETEEKYKEEQEKIRKLEAMTVDYFQPGEMQPERDHKFKGENSANGEAFGRKWRDARDGGFIEFEMKTDPARPCVLVLTYWGGDAGNRNFDILIDGEKIATQRLENNVPGKFFEAKHEIPAADSGSPDRKSVKIRLQAHRGAMAGGLFGARVIKGEE